MATANTAYSLIRQYIKTNVIDNLSFDCDIIGDNDQLEFSNTVEAWARLSIQGTPKQIEIGTNPLFRLEGTIYIQFFVPIRTGDAKVQEFLQYLDMYCTAALDNSIRYREPTIQPVGEDPECGMWLTTFSVRYWYDYRV